LTCGFPDDPCWTAGREAMLIRMVDALHDSCDVYYELWRSAQEQLDERQQLDVPLLCGSYHAICFAARIARVDLEHGAPRFADVTAA
ncbi:MAG: carboxymuconolactone decarboxylase, partial [Dactylosporangium sp.]|nr:carboxymuconolactone decarboxylase [Dactylosporangium sp.]